jgi:FKBP-type peptidyl-prolyl cis-trans isomerase SlyD
MGTTTNKLIILSYKLYTTEDGEKELVEEATKEHPYQFISGMDITLDAFEVQVVGLNKGDKFDFTILCKDAYGEYEDERVIDLPRKTFEVNGHFDKEHIYKDAIVPLMDAEGNRMNSTVVEVTDTLVTVDLNHPLAGADLTFVGEIIESRLATKDEIEGMTNLLHSHDDCCCGCDDDCDKDECNHEPHHDGKDGNCCGEHGHCHCHHN